MRKLTSVVVVLLLMSMLFVPKGEHEATAVETKSDAADAIVTVVYRVHDLPVWTAEQKFDPTVMIRLIQGTVSPSTWEAEGGESIVAPYPKNSSLVISTQMRNHDKIQELLKSMRPASPVE